MIKAIKMERRSPPQQEGKSLFFSASGTSSVAVPVSTSRPPSPCHSHSSPHAISQHPPVRPFYVQHEAAVASPESLRLLPPPIFHGSDSAYIQNETPDTSSMPLQKYATPTVPPCSSSAARAQTPTAPQRSPHRSIDSPRLHGVPTNTFSPDTTDKPPQKNFPRPPPRSSPACEMMTTLDTPPMEAREEERPCLDREADVRAKLSASHSPGITEKPPQKLPPRPPLRTSPTLGVMTMLDASPPIVARGEKILSLDPEVDMPAQSALSSPLEVLAPGCRTADPDGEAHEGALDGPGSLLGFSPSVHASFSENTANVRSRRARDEYSRFMTGIGITFRGVEGVWRVTAV